MNWFLGLKVSVKLALAFGLGLLLTLLIGGVAVQRMNVMNDQANLVVSDALGGSSAMTNVINQVRLYRSLQLRFIIAQSNGAMDALSSQMSDTSSKIDKALQDYGATITQPDDRANFADFKDAWTAFRSYDKQTEAVGRSNNVALGDKLMNGPSEDAFHRVIDEADKMADWNKKRGEILAGEANAVYASAKALLGILLVFSLLAGIVCSMTITRYIVTSLNTVIDNMLSYSKGLSGLADNNDAVGQGDFNYRPIHRTQFMSWDRKDEFGDLARAFDTALKEGKRAVGGLVAAQASLSQMVSATRTTADTIASSSHQLASGNEDLAARTTEQASSLEETAASMEEMTSIVKQSASNAASANALAAEARNVALQGGDVVHQAVTSMLAINESSKKIADIVSVIDEIAFQTNLLALNAAVEAARVGEQGRGFAVVASEVRSLAGRSSTAAKEIKTLVQDSVHKVEDGTVLVNKSGEQLHEIVTAVDKVAEVVGEISSAAQEQSAGIEQVNKAVIQLDEITQRNAALVEEATAASLAMSHQAGELSELVGRFKIDESKVQQTAPPVAVAVAATGTHGAARSATPRKPQLRMVHDAPKKAIHDDMEEF
ncbi:MAG: methyl-accepting chemotaxis protein [Capsulimonadaceae bacterium]|nr:methyl-accepting chemotaxis protein [Capsulimonadaceae bacterium]